MSLDLDLILSVSRELDPEDAGFTDSVMTRLKRLVRHRRRLQRGTALAIAAVLAGGGGLAALSGSPNPPKRNQASIANPIDASSQPTTEEPAISTQIGLPKSRTAARADRQVASGSEGAIVPLHLIEDDEGDVSGGTLVHQCGSNQNESTTAPAAAWDSTLDLLWGDAGYITDREALTFTIGVSSLAKPPEGEGHSLVWVVTIGATAYEIRADERTGTGFGGESFYISYETKREERDLIYGEYERHYQPCDACGLTWDRANHISKFEVPLSTLNKAVAGSNEDVKPVGPGSTLTRLYLNSLFHQRDTAQPETWTDFHVDSAGRDPNCQNPAASFTVPD